MELFSTSHIDTHALFPVPGNNTTLISSTLLVNKSSYYVPTLRRKHYQLATPGRLLVTAVAKRPSATRLLDGVAVSHCVLVGYPVGIE